MKKMILIGVGLMLLNVVSVGGTLFFSGALDKPPVVAEEEIEVVEPIPRRPIYYHNVQPEFVVNFDSKERPRALLSEIVVASYSEEALGVLDTHSPELRNNILILMTAHGNTGLATVEGKEALREAVKNELNRLMLKHTGMEEVEDVFFTRFVLQ
ncbi:MAG: flagellar basal body-associated FliL family protein [Granulosicoccus sp.]|nr:flagellar basal body-associated FliL family protein [Granulosicoccus sp.]